MHIVAEDFKKPLVLLALIVLGIATGILPAVIPLKFLPYFIGACVFFGVGLFSLSRPLFLLYFVILTSALAGLFRTFESLNFGTTSFTVSGFKWILIAGIILLVLIGNIQRAKLPRHFLPLVLFVFWVIIRWFSSSLNPNGLKDIVWYGLPILIGMYTLLIFSISKKPLVENIEKVFSYSVFIPLVMYIILIFSGDVYITKYGPRGIVVPRAVADYLLVVLALNLAHWRYAINETHRYRAACVSLLALGIIVFSLSRMATAIALLLFVIFKINPFKLWKVLLSGLLVVILSASVLLGISSFRARLFRSPPSNLAEAQEYLITSGRNKIWPATFNHALEKPVWGWGPGSARPLVAGSILGKGVKEWHPHNEYLQVFHDTGIIGLTLLLVAWLLLFVRYWKKWRLAHISRDVQRATWNMAVFLCILTVLINAIVDNTLHYPFIVAPVFIIIGCADFLNRHLPSSRREKLETGGIDLPRNR